MESWDSIRLFAILKSVHLVPTCLDADKFSEASYFLGFAVEEYPRLSPEADTMKKEIQSVIDEETKASELYDAWTNLKRNQLIFPLVISGEAVELFSHESCCRASLSMGVWCHQQPIA